MLVPLHDAYCVRTTAVLTQQTSAEGVPVGQLLTASVKVGAGQVMEAQVCSKNIQHNCEYEP
jgi:hypothetical protein